MKQCELTTPRSFGISFAVSLLLVVACAVIAAAAQQQPGAVKPADSNTKTPAQQATPKDDRGTWRVRVTKGPPQTFSVKAKEARASDIANDIARRLKVSVLLSPVMQKRRVTLDFAGLTLDAALRMLAPKPYIDYEVGGADAMQPKVLAIYLYALNERPPDASVALGNKSEAILIEGDTEEGTEEYERRKKKEEPEPLTVTFSQNQLSVKARHQPLTVVLYKVATEVGIPFEMRYDTTEVIDVEFSGYTLEQAVRALSPAARYYFRTDLQTFETQPLRITVVAPATPRS
jgi:hypothetical protein